MSLNIIFWVLMVLALFGGGWANRENFTTLGGWGITWFLIALLGWKVYPIAMN